MKLNYIYVFLILFFVNFLRAKNCEELFWNAKNQYAQGDIQGALASYEKIEPKGWGVWYNIGVCWYELHEPLQALVAWHKAYQEGGWRDKNLKERREVVEKELGLKNYSSRMQQLQMALATSSPLFFQLMLLILWWLTLFFYRKWGTCWWTLASLTGVISSFSLLGGMMVLKQRKIAIIAHPQAVYAGMHNEFTSLGELVPGDEVRLLVTQNNWAKVQHSAMTGWVPAQSLIEV